MSSPSSAFCDTWFDDCEPSSDDAEAEVTLETAQRVSIPFGKKHRGAKLGALVKSKGGRSYLRYLTDWDGLFDELRANIECVLTAYQNAKCR